MVESLRATAGALTLWRIATAMATLEHPARHDRLRRLAAEYRDARTREYAARRYGDADGADYARAEARAIRRTLEG